MSLLPAPEHVTWEAADVTVAQVRARLGESDDAATLTLVVAAGDDVPESTLRTRLEELGRRHPARTLVLREQAQERLDATIALDRGAPASARLVAGRERLAHADALVGPLLVPGVPSMLWLPSARSIACEQPLARSVEAVLLDSALARDPRDGFARAARLGAATTVRDHAWLRLAGWRRRLAATFDAPQRCALTRAVERVEIGFSGPDAATPLLLAGWLAARAGWSLQRVGGGAETWSGTAQRADGGRVALTLGSHGNEEGATDGIHELALHADGEALTLDEPAAEPSLADALASALRAVEEPAPGYEAALAAIAQGLAAAR